MRTVAALTLAIALASCTFPSVDYRKSDGGAGGGAGGAPTCVLPENCKHGVMSCLMHDTPKTCAEDCVMCATGTCDAAAARPPCDQAAGVM